MAYPTNQITGNIYTAGGDTIVAGRITAYIQPAGALVMDDSGVGWHKISTKTEGYLNGSGITSFYLTTLNTTNPADAYYQLHFEMQHPFKENWYELWKVTGTPGAAIAIGEIPPFQYGPYLPKASYAPVLFTPGQQGPQGPTGAPGSFKRTVVVTLPTLTESLVGYGYLWDRSAIGTTSIAYDAQKTAGGTLTWVYLYDV